MKNLFSNMHSNSCIYDNNYDLNYYMLYNNRFKFNMPPPLIIAPSLSANLSFIPCDSNSLGSTSMAKMQNQSFAADRGNEFSVSSQINADSGSSGTYIAVRDVSNLTDVQPSTHASRIGVMVANGQTIFSTHTGTLSLPSGHSLTAHIFSDLNTSLLSIGDLADIGYTIIYSKVKVEFKLKNKTEFEGQRDVRTGLWMVDFSVFKSQNCVGKAKLNRDTCKTLETGCASKITPNLAQPAVEVKNQK